jgi:macrolide transport system ATP-binding/permease protein
MNFLREWCRRAWYLLNRRRIEAALREEMEDHRTRMARPGGFGNTLRLREEAQDVWGWQWLDDLGRDLRFGVRSLRQSPGFALTFILILSVGIGVNLAFFQVVNVTLLQPLRVTDPDTLVYFHYRARTFDSSEVPYPVAMFVRDNTNVLSAVLVSRSASVVWGEAGDERLDAEFVSARWFEELGASPAAGRLLQEAVDGVPSGSAVVILSHGFWQRHLAGRADIVGSSVRINGRPAVVVGVADARFAGLRPTSPQLWMAIEHIDYFQPGSRLKTDWSTQSINMYGRLRAGISPQAAKASVQATLGVLSSIRPDAVAPGQWLEPYSSAVRFMSPRERRQIWAIAGASTILTALVLAIACLNLSNLALARAIARIREMSIRTALGAGRWRVMRHLAAESALLACAGTAGGALLGFTAASILAPVTALPAVLSVVPDWRTAVAGVSVAFVTTVAIGFAPVWKIGREDLTLATRDGGERASHGLHAARLRHWLVAGQIAGSSVLLVFAGHVVHGLQRALDSDLGFNVGHVAVLQPPVGGFGVTGSAVPSYWDDVRAIVGAHPDTAEMTLVSAAPLGDGIGMSRYRVAQHVWFRAISVDSAFFSTLQIPILAGRAFERGDSPKTAVIVSRRGALGMYGTLDILGQGFPKGQASPQVVGVAGDAQLSQIQATDMAELYWPLQVGQANAMLVRTNGDPSRLLVPLRDAARATDPRVVPEIRLLRDDFDRALQQPRLASTIVGVTALVALALATVGIFGVVSYGAGLRIKEIGIRLALGAHAGSIVRTLLRPTLWSGAVGAVLGLAGSWPASRAFAGAPLYVQPLDSAAYVSAGATLLVAASIAALLPAWRTLRQDPLRALRHE